MQRMAWPGPVSSKHRVAAGEGLLLEPGVIAPPATASFVNR